MPRVDGRTLRAWRRSRGWDVPEAARQLRRAARDDPMPAHDSLVRMIYRWERGAHVISERYELLYRQLGLGEDHASYPEPSGLAAQGAGMVTRSGLAALSSDHLDELIHLLDDQWHTLVRTDNLLGPRHALSGVRVQLGLIEDLLRSVRTPWRANVLQLGARYAESAAWLHEDSGDLPASRYWTGRSMEWALEAGDRPMMSWALYRRGEHATANGDAAAVAGLAAAARREGGELPEPMLAAILQQEAHAHALDRAEAACLATLDEASELAASPDDPGDASSGHGSFCTLAYLEMQRGRCLLRLGRPARARAALEGAIGALPPVYRRDRGVALSALAAAYAELGEPGEAATTALEALEVARDAGSERIVSMIVPVAARLASYRRMEAVSRLDEALAETGT
jgi:tetratricopeptide (TPR) repeat protein